MKLTALSFNPTKDFKDFAESFRRSVLQDDALREYVKRRQGKDPEKDKTAVNEEEILQALDALDNELQAKGASPMAAHVRNLAGALRNLKIVAENIRDGEGQRPEEEASQRAQNAWMQAAACMDALGGQTPESPSMLESAKTYLKGGQHEELDAADRDADELYDAIQNDPAGKLLLRAGHLAADGMMKGSLLERKSTFGNFLYRDHELSKMDRQEEINFFLEITEETKNILLLDPEKQQEKTKALEEEYAALQEQLRNRNVWFRENPKAQNALEDFKAGEEIQALYRKTARDLAYRQTQEAARQYRDEIGARNEKNKDRNWSIKKFNDDVDRRQNALKKEKQIFEEKCRELEGLIPQGQTQEEATRELNKKTEEPRRIKDRIEGTRKTIYMQEQREKKLAQAMEYPRLFDKMQLSPAEQRLQEQSEAKRKNLELLKQLQLRSADLGRGNGRGLNLRLTDADRTKVLKACTDLEKAYAARENALDTLLRQYQKGLSSLKPGDKDLEEKKRKMAERYEASRRNLRIEHKALVEKAQEKAKALADQGLKDQVTVLVTLAEGARLFPGKVSALSLELFGPMGTRQLDELINNVQKETERDAEKLRQSNPKYFEIKEFLQSPDYLGSRAGGQQMRGYKDWSPEELSQALEQTQNGIKTVKESLQKDEKLLETNLRIYREEEAKIRLLPTKTQVDDAKAALKTYRDAESAALEATEKGIPEKKESIRIFTEEELDKIAENRHLQMTEKKSRELAGKVRQDLSYEVEKRFHEQNTMRADFVKKAHARKTAIDVALNQIGQMKQENSPISRFYAKRQENYERNRSTLQNWENQLTVQNPYPEQVKNRLDELYRQIDAGRKKGHNDTELFRAMSGALTEARNFLSGENSSENLDKLRRMDQETLQTFRGLLQELNRSAAHYETERKKGIHWIASNMHYVRLDLARNLQNFAADTQAGLSELEAVETQRLQKCRDAIDRARAQKDAEPEPPATLNEFIRDAYELSRDPNRAQKQHDRNVEERKEQLELQEQQDALIRQQLNEKLESAQNSRSGEADKFTEQEKQLNLMYNLQRWGGEMDSLLADMQKKQGEAEEAQDLRSIRAVAVHINSLGKMSAMKLENNLYQAKSGEDRAEKIEEDNKGFQKELAGMGEKLQLLQAAEKMLPEGSPEREHFRYITRQMIMESNDAAAKLNEIVLEAEPMKADYPVPQEADAKALQTYREAHHIQTGVLASGETVELGWQLQQRENAIESIMFEAVNRSAQARELLSTAEANLRRRQERGAASESVQTELNEMKSVMTVLEETENKWNERLTEYRNNPARRQEMEPQILRETEQLGTWAERTLLPYAEADLAPYQDHLNRAEQNSRQQQARDGFVLLNESLMQWGNYARRQLQILNPQQEAPRAEDLQAAEEPEELQPGQEEIADKEASDADNKVKQANAEEEAHKVKAENDKAADNKAAAEVVPAEAPEQSVKIPEELDNRRSAMEVACLSLQDTLQDIQEEMMNLNADDGEARSQDSLTDAEKEQLSAMEQVKDKMAPYAGFENLMMGAYQAEKKAMTSEEIVREMQEISRFAVEKLPLLQKAAIQWGSVKQLNDDLKKVVEIGNGAVEWLKGVQPDTSVQSVELPEEALQAEEKAGSVNQAQQRKAEKLERQRVMEEDQNSLLEEQKKLEDAKKALEEEDTKLAREQADRMADSKDTMNVLQHPELRPQRLQMLLDAAKLCGSLKGELEELNLPEDKAQETMNGLCRQLQEFNDYADTLNFEQVRENVQETEKQEECLTLLAPLGKAVYEKALPIVKTLEDSKQRDSLREKLEKLAEAGNWAVDEYRNANPFAQEMEKTVLIREEEPKAPAPEEIPVPQQEKQEKQEKPSAEPQPAKRQAAVFNRAEMQQLLAWCDTVEELSKKHFPNRQSVILPAEYALMSIRRTVNTNLPNVNEAGQWLDKKPDSDPANYKARLAMTNEERREYSGEHLRKTFVKGMSDNAATMTTNLLPIQNDMLKLFNSFQKENPGQGNEALEKDILRMNEALTGLMQYSRDATAEFNKTVSDPTNRLALPKLPPRVRFEAEENLGVDYRRLLDDIMIPQSNAAMETVSNVMSKMKAPSKPEAEPEPDPIEVFVEVAKHSAKGKEYEHDESYIRNQAAAARVIAAQRREEKMQQAEAEYRTEYRNHQKRYAEFSKTFNILQEPYILAIENSRKLKNNKDAFALPKDQMELYGSMADKLTESVRAMQELQHKHAQNGTMSLSQQKAFSESALRLAKLSNYVTGHYNKLAAESKQDIQPIAEIDLTPMETEQAQWKADARREQEQRAQDSANARKRREERLKKQQEKKQEQKAEVKKQEPKQVAAEEKETSHVWDKLKKWKEDREKAEELKEAIPRFRGSVKDTQWIQYQIENYDTLHEAAKAKNMSYESFSQGMKEWFMKLPDAEREQMAGIKVKMPDWLRDDKKAKDGQKEKTSDQKKTAEKGKGPVKGA